MNKYFFEQSIQTKIEKIYPIEMLIKTIRMLSTLEIKPINDSSFTFLLANCSLSNKTVLLILVLNVFLASLQQQIECNYANFF
ncbi:MAG: hypothetical protein KA767_14925, partial [Saprospiraceae bacterium]|nr:hypothetical protein [Saprospiraceae bacterium]